MADGEDRSSKVGLVAVAVVAIALLIFVLQNTRKAKVTWLVTTTTTSTWLVIVASALAGALMGWLISLALRRRD